MSLGRVTSERLGEKLPLLTKRNGYWKKRYSVISGKLKHIQNP